MPAVPWAYTPAVAHSRGDTLLNMIRSEAATE
jgi:hypothetical protein